MSVLNYANLDPKEFESLAKDVMEKILGIPMERFGEGKDGGVDLTEESGKRRIIVQCKRYLETGSTEAVRRLKNELPKVQALDPQPKSYYIFTTASLMPQQVSYLRDCFSDYMESDANIIYREKIEDFFNNPDNEDVLRKHLRLVDSRPGWFKEVKKNDKITEYYAQEERTFTNSQKGLCGLEGDESLESAYIEAMTEIHGRTISLLDAVEEWYDPERHSVLLLHGQPGHGKTTFCRKAVFEFIRKRRFQNAKHVLWFPLNQEGLISGDEIKIPQIFHARDEEESLLTLREAKGSIIFLDGYDEVKLQLQNTKYKTYEDFFRKLSGIAMRYQIHFIVTSRTNAVKDDLRKCISYVFAPLSPKQQEDYCLKREKPTKYWNDFLKQICTQPENESEQQLKILMTIPFLFRIVVEQEYHITDSIKNQARLYEDLFEQIMVRHFGKDKIVELNRNYQQLAYDIWCNDEDTAESGEDIWEELLFSYFMKSEREKILGFVHRTFYQYYLALYFYEELKELDPEEFLKLLAERIIDDDVYVFFTQIAGNKREQNATNSARNVIEKLNETEAVIITSPKNMNGEVEKSRLERCRNIFYNAIQLSFTYDVINTFNKSKKIKELIGKYDSSDLFLYPKVFGSAYFDGYANLQKKKSVYVDLSKSNLSGAHLIRTHLSKADLSGADLDGADLREIVLDGADLNGASLLRANLRGADLRRDNLSKASLREADLSLADLKGASLLEANLKGANLRGADLRGTVLNEANLRGANLRGAHLSEAKMKAVELSEADLSGVDLKKANLRGAKLQGANLTESNLMEANLRGADLRGADLRKANLQRAFLRGTDLRGDNLNGANLCRTELDGTMMGYITDYSISRLNICTSLRKTKFTIGSLDNVDTSKVDLSEVIWCDKDGNPINK